MDADVYSYLVEVDWFLMATCLLMLAVAGLIVFGQDPGDHPPVQASSHLKDGPT